PAPRPFPREAAFEDMRAGGASMSSHPKGEGNPGALRLPGLRHVARVRPKAASGMDTRTTRAKTPASLRPATASAPVPPFRPPARASAISTGSGIRGHARRAREHVLSPKGRGEPGCASLTRATTRSPDNAKGRIRDGHPNHPRQDTSLAPPGNGPDARRAGPPPCPRRGPFHGQRHSKTCAQGERACPHRQRERG